MGEFSIFHWALAAAVFYLLWKVFRRAVPRDDDGKAPKIRGPGRFAVEVVGESFYRDALKARFGLKRGSDDDSECEASALLRLEDDNPHDSQAVGVYIDGAKVGHLSRAMARDFRQSIKRDGLSRCKEFVVDAVVYLPEDDDEHYSVSLDLPKA